MLPEHYNILITESGGDYTNSSMYTDPNGENVGTITDGSTGYTVTALSSSGYVHHSCQLVNNLSNNIDKNLGILKVELTGDDGSPPTYDFKDIYDEIVASGYEDYVYYDGTTFTFKGTIEAIGTAAGSLADTRKTIHILRGCLRFANANFTCDLGTWTSDEAGANYYNACTINVQNCRYPIYGVSGVLKWYGCLISYLGIPLDQSENLNYYYYHGAGQQYLADYVNEIQDCIVGYPG
jgi:hypothetical protein